MLIKKDGIFRNIDAKEFGIWQQLGFEKVVNEPIKVVEPKPVVEEAKVEEPEKVIELPKSKKKKK